MNPGVERQATGTLPQARAVSTIVCATSGAVAWPATTSTSGSTGAGLKKCMPTTRSGRASRPAIAVTDSDEVFVAMIVSAPTSLSIWRSTATLTSRFSTMTSITRPTPSSGTSAPTGTTRATVASRSAAASLPRCTRLSRLVRIWPMPRSSAVALVSRR